MNQPHMSMEQIPANITDDLAAKFKETDDVQDRNPELSQKDHEKELATRVPSLQKKTGLYAQQKMAQMRMPGYEDMGQMEMKEISNQLPDKEDGLKQAELVTPERSGQEDYAVPAVTSQA